MSTSIQGVAVVTGATGGIGAGVALELAARGVHVVVSGRSQIKADGVLSEIRARGGQATFVAGDVRSGEDMSRLVERAAGISGDIDIVVSSAGGGDEEARTPRVRGPFAEIDLGRAARFVEQAMLAKLLVVQAAIPYLRSSGRGSVVLVTSEGGRVPTPGQTAMSSFAGGLIMTSKVLAKELAPDRIRINTVCVTAVRDSPSWHAVFDEESVVSESHRRQYERIVERSPLGVAGPEDIGKVVAFLASDEAAYFTGCVLSPTGGLTYH